MKLLINVNEMRDPTIQLHGLTKVDDEYTLYYDETNNIRRLYVTPHGFNVREPMCFVLGGIAHGGPPRPLDIVGLRNAVRLQPSAKEVKLEYLGKGSFLQILASEKIEIYLRWLLDHGLFIHYQATDPLYWSTVDIIDSIITDTSLAHLQPFHQLLKDDLFTVVRLDVDQVAELYHRYSYPNIGRAQRSNFIAELRNWLDMRAELLLETNFQVLKGVLEAGARIKALPYLEDETPNTLIESFSGFFIDRICLFKNASHILDVEEVIKARLEAMTFRDGDRVVHNYRFVDSTAESGVQVSDPLVGLLGKFLSYVRRTHLNELVTARRTLTSSQCDNLSALEELMDRAHAETPAFIQHIMSLTDIERAREFLEGFDGQ
jgi:hypothetical protein